MVLLGSRALLIFVYLFHQLLSDILIVACLVGGNFYLIVALSCISLSSSKTEGQIKYFLSSLIILFKTHDGTLPIIQTYCFFSFLVFVLTYAVTPADASE